MPKLNPIINTLTELAASSQTKMTVNFEMGKARMFLVGFDWNTSSTLYSVQSSIWNFVYGIGIIYYVHITQEATSGPYKVIGDSLRICRNHPELLVKGDSIKAMNNVLQRGATYFAVRI